VNTVDIQAPHVSVEPAILYFGTPVVLVSTVNEDGSFNVAPFSSAFWLAWRCVLGMASASKTPGNMIRTGECVINLPSADQVDVVNRLSRLTGSNPIPPNKSAMGYSHEKDKFGIAGLTPIASETVSAPRVRQCLIQLEAVVVATHRMMEDDDAMSGFCTTIEVRIKRVHVHPSLLMTGKANRIELGRVDSR
jgi:flavin reductase (DIM6/NTAB) family NADH-FMN oxidoreductase RutF